MDRDRMSDILKNALGEGFRENVPMRDYTTMRVGGVADYFYEAREVGQLILALHLCFENNFPYIVIGNGSNIIFSDAGYPGLVIRNLTSNISFITDKSQVIVDSGTILARLITEAAARDLGGLEYWFGLPGTVGGAVHNNVETWGHAISEVVKQITVVFPPHGDMPSKIERVSVDWMRYGYRQSKLKAWPGDPKPVILTVTLQLQQQRKEEIMRRMKEKKAGRFELNQPKGMSSAGSFFMNPGGMSHGDGDSLPPESSAAWLLEQVGAKHMKVGGAAISKQHANFVVNSGNASAHDIHELANRLKDLVRNKFKIELDEEIEYLGVWDDHSHKGEEK